MSTALHAYIDAWERHDIAGVLAALTDDCLVIESHGPTYHGRDQVEHWMRTWLTVGSVDQWRITSTMATDDDVAVEWAFTSTYEGDTTTFEGATIARLTDGRIAYLREYATITT